MLSLLIASQLLSPFLVTQSLSMSSSLKGKVLYIIIDSFVLLSIFLSSSHIQFKKGREYFTRETAKVFLRLDFCCRVWFREVFFSSGVLPFLLCLSSPFALLLVVVVWHLGVSFDNLYIIIHSLQVAWSGEDWRTNFVLPFYNHFKLTLIFSQANTRREKGTHKKREKITKRTLWTKMTTLETEKAIERTKTDCEWWTHKPSAHINGYTQATAKKIKLSHNHVYNRCTVLVHFCNISWG